MPRVDLIVPTVTGREESLTRCLDSFEGVNPIVVLDEPTCGAGWIKGLESSTAPYIVLCCDDIENAGELEPGIEAIDRGLIPAPIIHRPDGSLESAGGDMGAPACLLSTVQDDWTPIDFTPLPFLGREQIERIGLIPSHYMSDVWVSHRGREVGYETVLCHGFELVHHHEMVGRKGPSPTDDRIYREAMASAGI